MQQQTPFKYQRRVKVSGWYDAFLSGVEPLDQNHREAHFRTFGNSDGIFIPKTSTQELYDTGLLKRQEKRPAARGEINSMTYSLNDFRFQFLNLQEPEITPLTTTYQEIYKAPRTFVGKTDYEKVTTDPLLNRKPKNELIFLPSSTTKFMDDHWVNLSEGRKKINIFRQMRNVSNIFNIQKV